MGAYVLLASNPESVLGWGEIPFHPMEDKMNDKNKMNEIAMKFEARFTEVAEVLEAADKAGDKAAYSAAVTRFENGVDLLRAFCEDGRLSMKEYGDRLIELENVMMNLRVIRGRMFR